MSDNPQEEYQEDKPPIFAAAEAEAAEAPSPPVEAPKGDAPDSPPVEEPEVRESSVQKAKVVETEDGREALKTNSGVVFGYK